jgi:hypothetical protein
MGKLIIIIIIIREDAFSPSQPNRLIIIIIIIKSEYLGVSDGERIPMASDGERGDLPLLEGDRMPRGLQSARIPLQHVRVWALARV